MALDRKVLVTLVAVFSLSVLAGILVRDHMISLGNMDVAERYADISDGTGDSGFRPIQETAGMSPAEVSGADVGAAAAVPGGSGLVGMTTGPEYAAFEPSATDGGGASGCLPRDMNTAEDLLPDGAASLWAQQNPLGQGAIGDQNFLTAGHHIGVVTSNMRNSNMGLRSEPPNPIIKNVSIWQQSTIQPDLTRRKFEIA